MPRHAAIPDELPSAPRRLAPLLFARPRHMLIAAATSDARLLHRR